MDEDSIDEDFDLPEDATLETEVLGSDVEEKKVKVLRFMPLKS